MAALAPDVSQQGAEKAQAPAPAATAVKETPRTVAARYEKRTDLGSSKYNEEIEALVNAKRYDDVAAIITDKKIRTDWRLDAVAALFLGNKESETKLAQLLTSADEDTKVVILRGLGNDCYSRWRRGKATILEPETVRALGAALQDPSEKVRRSAATTLGLTSSEDAVAPLSRYAQSTRGFEHYKAIEALALTGASASIPELAKGLLDKSTRAVAAAGLAALGDRAGEAILAAEIESGKLRGRSDLVSIVNLTEDPRLLKALTPMMLTDRNSQVRSDAELVLRNSWSKHHKPDESYHQFLMRMYPEGSGPDAARIRSVIQHCEKEQIHSIGRLQLDTYERLMKQQLPPASAHPRIVEYFTGRNDSNGALYKGTDEDVNQLLKRGYYVSFGEFGSARDALTKQQQLRTSGYQPKWTLYSGHGDSDGFFFDSAKNKEHNFRADQDWLRSEEFRNLMQGQKVGFVACSTGEADFLKFVRSLNPGADANGILGANDTVTSQRLVFSNGELVDVKLSNGFAKRNLTIRAVVTAPRAEQEA